jgi:DNA-binding CsgD family transcriptional regulator
VALLERLYELTPTEAALAIDLASGRTLAQAAKAREVSVNTVRTHLRAVFQKTGTRRQSELVRLLLTGPASLGAAARAGGPRPIE